MAVHPLLIAAGLFILVASYFNMLWLLKCAYAGYWCYFINTYLPPGTRMFFTIVLAVIFVLTTLIPSSLVVITTIISIPPQIHMLYILYMTRQKFIAEDEANTSKGRKDTGVRNSTLISLAEAIMFIIMFFVAWSTISIVSTIVGKVDFQF